jgi:hypothetical protein
LHETQGKSEKEIRAALLAAYPFGYRRCWPYKVWCDEIRRQRLKKPPLRGRTQPPSCEGQKELF